MNFTILHEYPSPDLEDKWHRFLARADFPAHYVSPTYFREPFLRAHGQFAILAWHNSEIVAALTGLHQGPQVISGQMSRPQICFDKSIDPEVVALSLIEGLLAEGHSSALITLFTWSPIKSFEKHGYQYGEEEGVVMLDLTQGSDVLFKSFSSTRRNDIRGATKRGVEVFIAETREEFRLYHEIYVDWCERKKIVPESLEAFEETLLLCDNRRLFLARHEGKVIAGTIIRVYPGEMIEYAANSSFAENLKLKPNDLLQWRVVEWACEQGFKRYSLGGAHLFSRKMGGTILPVYRYRLDRTWLRRHDLKEALGHSGRKMFKKLPIGVQNQVRRAFKRDG
jgi:Acetyltransferase (GNAT) domain